MIYRPLPAAAILTLAALLAACSSTPKTSIHGEPSFVAPPRPATAIHIAPLKNSATAWPAITTTNKPFTRWWWLGSAVTPNEIARQLNMLHNAGEGGVEICPIYGVIGNEPNNIPFLSKKWLDMLAAATSSAKALNMVVDMTTGTGWPFGGGPTTPTDASSSVTLKRYTAKAGAHFTDKLPTGSLQYAGLIAPDGTQTDITSHTNAGAIDLTLPASPAGDYRIYVITQTDGIQQVKRAAPGGEGLVLDPYDPKAMRDYLSHFDTSFKNAHYIAPNPRAQFHDSFEYYGANWTDNFLSEFQKRRGYDLRTQLPALLGEDTVPPDIAIRVKCDYRETIADLHLAYMKTWVDWAHAKGELTRNQAHGSPANILDAYAVSDIPECEIFHLYEEAQLPFLKLASSAAHVTGKALSSSESFTWLGDHFAVSLNDVKPAADFLFTAGVNHIFFHGTPYSPAHVPWPGYNFYASVNFGPNGGLFHDLPAFNAYVAHIQSILQANKPSSDVLLYMPFYECWQHQYPPPTELGSGQTPASAEQNLMFQFTTPGDWMKPFPFYTTAMTLEQKGYPFDEISDNLLQPATSSPAGVSVGGNSYHTLVVPKTPIIPIATLHKLIDLAHAGATVIFEGGIPTDVPGFADFADRRNELHVLIDTLHFDSNGRAAIGPGQILVGDNLTTLLDLAKTPREAMTDLGLRFVRRERPDGFDYFITNRSKNTIDQFVPLATPASLVYLMDPMFDDRVGIARSRSGANNDVYLQLQPGQSIILRTSTNPPTRNAAPTPLWSYTAPGTPIPITSTWTVHFTEKLDPAELLPGDFSTNALADYTSRGDSYKVFAGTAVYTTTFDAPKSSSNDYLLDLGKIGDSARVTLNGKPLGTLWAAPYQIHLGDALKPGPNTLSIEVTNIASNRIADFDRRGVKWKIFNDPANVSLISPVTHQYVAMDASTYPNHPAGLLTPLTLIPLSPQVIK